MSIDDQARRRADHQTVKDAVMDLHLKMNRRGVDQLLFFNALIDHAAWMYTAIVPIGQEQYSTELARRSLTGRLDHWFADPELRAMRHEAPGDPPAGAA